MKEGIGATFAALLAAVVGSLCCVGPVAAAFLGLGVATRVGTAVEPYRPYLIGVTVLLLGWAFYRVYRPEPACGDEKLCAIPGGKRLQKALLWAVTFVAAAALSFQYYSRFLL